MSGSKAGAAAIVRAFRSILQDHLQTALNEATTDLGVAYTLTAPDTVHGYSLSRNWPRDLSPAVCIVVESSAERDELHCLGAPRREDTTIAVTLQYAPTVADDAEEHLSLYARCIRTVILQYWRGYASDTCLLDVVSASEDSSSSLRERFQQQGFFQIGGNPPDSNLEQTAVAFDCVQNVYAPISWTP